MSINFAISVNWLQWIFMEYFKKVNWFIFFLSSLYFEWLLLFNIKLLYTFVIWVSTENVRNLRLYVIRSIKVTFIFSVCFWTFYGMRFLPYSYLVTYRSLENDVIWTVVNPFIIRAVCFRGLETCPPYNFHHHFCLICSVLSVISSHLNFKSPVCSLRKHT